MFLITLTIIIALVIFLLFSLVLGGLLYFAFFDKQPNDPKSAGIAIGIGCASFLGIVALIFCCAYACGWGRVRMRISPHIDDIE